MAIYDDYVLYDPFLRKVIYENVSVEAVKTHIDLENRTRLLVIIKDFGTVRAKRIAVYRKKRRIHSRKAALILIRRANKAGVICSKYSE